MIGCSYHCRACNCCFSSLKAFDAHREFAEGHQGDWDYRVCLDPMDDARFVLKATGVCNLARPKKTSARIWQLRVDRDAWRQRFPGDAESGPDGENGLDLGEAA